MDEGDPGFQLLTEEETAAVIFLLVKMLSTLPLSLNYPFICFLSSF
jgi:hypothetical protein